MRTLISRQSSSKKRGNEAVRTSHLVRPFTTPASQLRTSNQALQQQLRAGLVQPKLRISEPHDRYEQEADRVAESVMRMQNPVGPTALPADDPPSVQRMCTACEEDEIHRKSTPVATVAESEMIQPAGRGQPLPGAERDFFEPRFGQDFSSVRIHSGDRAAAAAAAINALAYTKGPDIVFGAGQYRPGTYSGRTLIAHELAHVVQQRGKAVAVPELQRLGANPGCNAAQRATIHQAIFDARGWLNRAIPQLETNPAPANVLRSLRRNFGPTYGVAANIPLILGRLRVVYREISTIPFGCSAAADATCTVALPPCGYSGEGSHVATICTNVTLRPGQDPIYQAGCVLHESFHAAFSNFTVDQYSGWHGHSGSTATYPGAGVDPLLNADSYTTLVMDLS